MTEPTYPPEPATDPGHILSEEDWAEVVALREKIAANLEDS